MYRKQSLQMDDISKRMYRFIKQTINIALAIL